MIKIKNYTELTEQDFNDLYYRFGDDFTAIMNDVAIPIAREVKEQGDAAVKKYTEKFDKIKLDSLMATQSEIDAGYDNTPQEVIEAFKEAKANIEEFHRRQLQEDIKYERAGEATLGVMYQPIDSAAIYVPGGKAKYPSSVLMGVIPAQIAGVENITVVTPPGPDGKISDAVCAVCKLLGVKNILKSGGAQGIAAIGFGTESVKKADLIVGPGNIFVTAAKSYLFSLGAVQIDSMAGPSEVLIIADEKANPKWVAWDLLSQAEHDERAMSVLLTTSQELAEKIKKEISQDIESGTGRSEIKRRAIEDNSLVIIVDSIEKAIDFSNKFGPEHMQFMVTDSMKYLHQIKNVGSLFMGSYAPVAVGDYYSGTNHILPTGGATRFASGVSVETFMRRTTYQYLTEQGLKKAQGPTNIMSKVEGFDDKHGGSINVRFEK
jgi:histidinol dehydrogenase